MGEIMDTTARSSWGLCRELELNEMPDFRNFAQHFSCSVPHVGGTHHSNHPEGKHQLPGLYLRGDKHHRDELGLSGHPVPTCRGRGRWRLFVRRFSYASGFFICFLSAFKLFYLLLSYSYMAKL